jgi:hypothetical protein
LSKAQNEFCVSGLSSCGPGGGPRRERGHRVQVAEVAQHDHAGRAQIVRQLDQQVLGVRRVVLEAVAGEQLRLGAADRLGVAGPPELLEAGALELRDLPSPPGQAEGRQVEAPVLERREVAHQEAALGAGHHRGDHLPEQQQAGIRADRRVDAFEERRPAQGVLGLLAQLGLLGLQEIVVRVIRRQLDGAEGAPRRPTTTMREEEANARSDHRPLSGISC